MESLDIFEGMEGAELIQDTFLFRKLDFDETTQLASNFERKSYKKGDVIIEENALGGALYIIATGSVDISKETENGQERLTTLEVGELFGEMSLIEDALTSASVTAVTECECFVLPKDKLLAQMKENPTFAAKVYEAFCHILSDRLRKTTDKLLASQIEASKF